MPEQPAFVGAAFLRTSSLPTRHNPPRADPRLQPAGPLVKLPSMSLHDLALAATLKEFQKTKTYAEKAFIQLEDAELHVQLHPAQCSIAAYIRHMAGNMRSRWTDFLTTDGEKPSRNREAEFAEAPATRAELMAQWEEGWRVVFDTLAGLKPGDLERTITIRTEPLSVIDAIIRQQAHYAWHVGQIALLAKHMRQSRGAAWAYMTIPPGGSAAFNKAKGL
jgi:hypothetical protein